MVVRARCLGAFLVERTHRAPWGTARSAGRFILALTPQFEMVSVSDAVSNGMW